MLRGSFLAALAGTATVCAGLVYLKPGESVREESPSGATADDSGREQSAATEEEEEETRVGVSTEASRPEEGAGEGEGEERLSRARRYRDGMRRWLTTVTPSARNLVR